MAPCIRHLERLGIESLSRRIMARFDRLLRDLGARLTESQWLWIPVEFCDALVAGTGTVQKMGQRK